MAWRNIPQENYSKDGRNLAILAAIAFHLIAIAFFAMSIEQLGGMNYYVANPVVAFVLFYDIAEITFLIQMKIRYKQFRNTMRLVEEIVADILRQSIYQACVNVAETCANHLLSYQKFKDNYVRNLDVPTIGENGELDLDAGKFYSRGWKVAHQLNQEDLNIINSEFDALGKFNLTRFAQKLQADFNMMKMLLFRYCGANNTHGQVEIAPNGDYLIVLDVVSTKNFVHDLDQFIEQVRRTEFSPAGKKAGGKLR